MPDQAIKGQAVSLLIIKDDQLQARINTIKDAEIRFELEIIESDYLGDGTTRFTAVFKGMSVRVTGELANRATIDLINSIVLQAQERAGGAGRIDMAANLPFPNGDNVTIGVPDISFSPIPINIGGRAELVEFTLEGKASEFEVL